MRSFVLLIWLFLAPRAWFPMSQGLRTHLLHFRQVGKVQTNYQIACELGIIENTVKLFVSQVLQLTHMRNRTQLALSPSNSGMRQWVTAH